MGDRKDKPEKSDESSGSSAKTNEASFGVRDEEKKSEDVKCSSTKAKGSSNNDISALLQAVEKRIREFFKVITKRVTDFLDNDLKQLKAASKEELAKLNTALLEYKNELDRISQEKLKRVGEMRTSVESRIMTAEEVQSFGKYFDEKMAEVKKMTRNIIETIRKNKVGDSFAVDLQNAVTDYNKKITAAMDGLFDALKSAAGDLSKSMPDKKTFLTKMPQMPASSHLQKISTMLRTTLKKQGASSTSTDASEKPQEVPSSAATLKGKLSALNLSKHFSNNTMRGRANVAKATYLGAFLYFLYWKFKKSEA